ncbi:unnamed protein product [Sphenostylis stenocarpa]|uniref:Uncharacterized protein n=1 Tax=Sphenostylis stenocarpa TaxID=92480 RepID=A0AA86VVJ7_9FABA|nr:unnamed protein product [Sphenostylis stenocarpa]
MMDNQDQLNSEKDTLTLAQITYAISFIQVESDKVQDLEKSELDGRAPEVVVGENWGLVDKGNRSEKASPFVALPTAIRNITDYPNEPSQLPKTFKVVTRSVVEHLGTGKETSLRWSWEKVKERNIIGSSSTLINAHMQIKLTKFHIKDSRMERQKQNIDVELDTTWNESETKAGEGGRSYCDSATAKHPNKH